MTDNNKYQPTTQLRGRQLTVRGVDYHINEWGDDDAPLFFYLHGWADAGSTFQFVVDALTERWRVIAPDWRGFGRSSHPSEAFWFPDYLADLHFLLQHYSSQESVRLVGHSMGGNIAALYAGSMPERVQSLINIEGFGLPETEAAEAPARYRKWLQAGMQQPAFSTYSSYAALARRLAKRNPGLGEAEADFVARQWACEDGAGVRLRANPNHKLPNPILYRRAEAEACWRSISADVLLVSGDRSPFRQLDEDSAALPFAKQQAVTLPDSGHMLHLEAAGGLAQQIEAFFKKSL